MLSTSLHASTPVLERTVQRLERRLIVGEARADEIDSYVRLQLELAARDAARSRANRQAPRKN